MSNSSVDKASLSFGETSFEGTKYKILVPEGSSKHFDEKSEDSFDSDRDDGVQVYEVFKDWTDEEERKLKAKADLIVMPLLIIGFFALQIDRGNISNALTDTFREDLGISQNQVNIGNQLLYVGIVTGEIPSNYVLQKIGPRWWISFQIVVWGIISLCQSFIHNYAQYIATRILLGFSESGFICAGLYCISCWYKKNELGKRHTFYYFGNYFSLCVSGYIAGGILKLGNITNWAGWRWLFLIEGLFTIFIGVIFLLFFPQSTRSTNLFWLKRVHLFTERESYILTNRLLLDDPIKLINLAKSMSMKDIITGLKKWRAWYHGLISFLTCGPFAGINTYYPSIIRAMGYTQFQLNAMSSVGYWIAAFASILFSIYVGKVKPYGAPMVLTAVWQIVFAITFRSIVGSAGGGVQYLILSLLEGSYMVIHVMNTYWVSVNAVTPTDRSVALALNIMLVNMGNIYGNQILRGEDLPLYQKGFLAAIILFATGLVAIVVNMLQYNWKNKKLDKEFGGVRIKNEDWNVSNENGVVIIDYTKQAGHDKRLELFSTFRYSP